MVAMATNSGKENRGKEGEKNKRIGPTTRAKKQSFKKRKECVLKKSMELSVLCDIKACAVVVDANGKVETWPENRDDLMKIIKLYQDYLDRKDGCTKNRVAACGQEATSEVADHQIVSPPQHELEDTESWIDELLLGEEETGSWTGMNDPMHDDMPGALYQDSCDGEHGKEADSEVADRHLILHSQHEPEEIHSLIEELSGTSAEGFLTDINDPLYDNVPAPLIVSNDEAATEPGIADDEQNIDGWLDTLVNWNSFEQYGLMLDSEFWR